MPRPLLAMVTDRRLYAGTPAGEDADGRTALVGAAAAAARAGVDLVQVRERGLDDGSLLALAEGVRDAIVGTARGCSSTTGSMSRWLPAADGVHLPGSAVACAEVRAIVPDGFLVGRSVHSVGEAMAAAADGGCDYLVFGTVFESRSKPAGHPVAGLDALAEVCAAVSAAGPGDRRHHRRRGCRTSCGPALPASLR